MMHGWNKSIIVIFNATRGLNMNRMLIGKKGRHRPARSGAGLKDVRTDSQIVVARASLSCGCMPDLQCSQHACPRPAAFRCIADHPLPVFPAIAMVPEMCGIGQPNAAHWAPDGSILPVPLIIEELQVPSLQHVRLPRERRHRF